MTDISKLSFFSGVNYMKRSSFSDNTALVLGAFGAVTTKVITHNLGYVPIVHVSYDAVGNGIIYPSEKVNMYTNSSVSGVYPPDPDLTFWATSTSLTINLTNNTSPTATGSRMVYWIIYLDYGNVG